MIGAAERELETAGVEQSPGVVLADAGYWSNDHIDSLRQRGRPRKRGASVTEAGSKWPWRGLGSGGAHCSRTPSGSRASRRPPAA
jgi:hypothetical protein